MSFSNTDAPANKANDYVEKSKDREVSSDDKVKDLVDFISSSKFGMLTTHDASNNRLVSRAMALAAKEHNGADLLFFTNTESHKTDELKSDPIVNLSFLDSSGQWASISGNTAIETDRSLVKKHYSPAVKAWFGDLQDGKHDGSENDPRIAIIRLKIDTATYAITDKTILGRGVEMVQAAFTGEVAAVNKIREISTQEVEAWRNKS